MKKFIYILKEITRLVWRNKLYFLFPILLSLALLGFMVYTLGPAALITFLYAGI